MGITFTNNWKNIADKLRSTFRTEFKGALPVYINDENVSTGGQYLQLDLASTSLSEKMVGCELREYTVSLSYIFQSPNVKKSSLDHVLRYTSRIEQLMQNNTSLSLTDSTAAVNCRIESTELQEGEDNSYLVSFDWKCQHLSGLSEVIDTTPVTFFNTRSLNFDGNDEYVDIGDSDDLIVGTNVTISTWFKNSSGTRAYMFQSRRGATSSNLSVGVNMNASGAEQAGWIGIVIYTGSGHSYTSYNGNVDDGAWHHFVATVSDGSQKLYLDGSLIASSTNAFPNDASADHSLIGSNSGSNRFMNGNIDEVALWNVVLDADAITAIYNSGTPTNLNSDSGDYDNSSNLQGWWRMGDGDTYPTITDNSSNSNNGTMNNMVSGDIEEDTP
jgi:hypothetical protein